MSLRALARAIFDSTLAAGDPRPLVRQALVDASLPERARVLVVGAGKASGAMAVAAEEALGQRIADGLVAVKDGYVAPTRRVRLVEAGHPLPDARGAAAAREVLALADSAGPDDLLLVLISGGGSALLPAPAPPITLEEKQAVTRLMLRAGATIAQLNVVRKHCSLLKGGQLARAAWPARVLALLLSDVIGDPVDVIASGPTAPDPSTFAEAAAILARFGLGAAVPASVATRLDRGVRGQLPETPKPGDPVFTRVDNRVIGNSRLVVDAAVAKARELGLAPHVLSPGIEGEAREVGARLATLARDVRAGHGVVAPPACLIAVGETTVTVRGPGKGGRCQELALAAAIAMEGVGGIAVLAAGTDGTDGPTGAAGALVDGTTVARLRSAGYDPGERLAANDSHTALGASGDLIVTGPTNTNLLDLYLAVVTPVAS